MSTAIGWTSLAHASSQQATEPLLAAPEATGTPPAVQGLPSRAAHAEGTAQRQLTAVGKRAGTWSQELALPVAAIGLNAATNQIPRAPSCEQMLSNVAPKNALTLEGAAFRGNSAHWQADRCSSSHSSSRPWALAAAFVPGVLVHGAGSWVLGDDDALRAMLWAEGAGAAMLLSAGSGIILTGASRWVVGPLAATSVLGVGLFGVSWLTDVYHVAVPVQWRGEAQRQRHVEAQLGYVYVYNPQFTFRHLVESRAEVRHRRWSFGHLGQQAPDGGYGAHRIHATHRPWQARRHASGRVDGSFFDIGTAFWQRDTSSEDFRTFSLEVAGVLRVDSERLVPSLHGAFSEWTVGYAMRSTQLLVSDALQNDDLLIAGAAFGAYLPGAGDRGGELRLWYNHRHDGLAGGMLSRGLSSGVLGHVGASASYYLSKHWGVETSAQLGSAWVLSAAWSFRGLGESR